MKFVVAILVALAVVAAADNVQFTVCGTQPIMTVSTLTVQPFPAVPGQNVNVTLIGAGSSSLTAGKYTIQANYMGITILTQTGDVCTLDPAHPCPMSAGPITISHTIPVPSIAPAGQYDIAISSTDQNGNTAVCLNFVLNIGSAKASSEDDADAAGLDFEILEPSIAIPEESTPVVDLPSTDMPAPEQDEIDVPELPAEEPEQPEQEQDEQPIEEEEDGLIEEDQPEQEQDEQPIEEEQPVEEEDDGLIEEELPNNAAPAQEDDSIPMEDGEEAEEPATEDDEEESDQQPVAEDSDETEVPATEDDEEQDEQDDEEFAPRNNEWKSCGDASDIFSVTSVTTPDGAPVPGKQFTVLVEGELSSEITGGSMTLKTNYDGIPVSSDNSDFCAGVANTSNPCPWAAGHQSLRYVSVIPDTTPAGDYEETLTAVDQNNKNVFCIVGTFTI